MCNFMHLGHFVQNVWGVKIHTSISIATIKASTLAFCGLLLWLLVRIRASRYHQYYGYPSSVSICLQRVYQNTCILWFKRKMDLELMFLCIISLFKTNWENWTKSFKSLLAISDNTFIDSTYLHHWKCNVLLLHS